MCGTPLDRELVAPKLVTPSPDFNQDRDLKLKGNLQLAWRLLRTWNTNEISNRAPPLPQEAVFAMVGRAYFHCHFSFGVSLLVAFYAMLRRGEVLRLKNSHIYINALPSSLWG